MYPNPVTTQATLELRLEQPDHLQVQLVNNAGQIVRSFSYEAGAGTTLYTIATKRLPAGIYVCEDKGARRVEKEQEGECAVILRTKKGLQISQHEGPFNIRRGTAFIF